VSGPVWARWRWEDTGWGRWHAVADTALGLYLYEDHLDTALVVHTACDRVRPRPQETGPRPEQDRCPECDALDALRERFGERQPVTVEAVGIGGHI
jgi:hypothetical protein